MCALADNEPDESHAGARPPMDRISAVREHKDATGRLLRECRPTPSITSDRQRAWRRNIVGGRGLDHVMAGEQGAQRQVGTPGTLDEQERQSFLAEPHVGVLSVATDDDRPPSTLPTWYAYQPGGNLSVINRAGRRKSRLIRAAGRVSFSVQRAEPPYRYVTVEGTVVKQEPATREHMLPILTRYLPADAVEAHIEWEIRGGNDRGAPEYVEIRPDRWLTADFSR